MKNDDRLSDTPPDVRMLCLSEPADADCHLSARIKELTTGVPAKVSPSTGWAARFRRFRERLQLRIAGLLYRLAAWVYPLSRASRRDPGKARFVMMSGRGSAELSLPLSELPPSVTVRLGGDGNWHHPVPLVPYEFRPAASDPDESEGAKSS